MQRPPFKKTATRPRAPRHDHAGATRGGQGATAHGRKRLPSAARRGAPRGDARASRGEEAGRTAMMAHMREGTWSDTVTTRQLRGSLWNRQEQTHSERRKLKARSRKHPGLENLQTIFTSRKSLQTIFTSRKSQQAAQCGHSHSRGFLEIRASSGLTQASTLAKAHIFSLFGAFRSDVHSGHGEGPLRFTRHMAGTWPMQRKWPFRMQNCAF